MNKPIPFGKYYLLERINVGGMAEVFRAKQFGVEGFERLVAVKRILPNIAEDKDFIEMFVDEAKISVQLTHANIAQVFDLGHEEGAYYIALEHIHGRDLRAIFDRNRSQGEPMPVPQACFVIMKACEGLDYAHNKREETGREINLVHRDVSPQNVLVSFDGEVKLIDFGIAKAAGKGSQTQAGILKGKFGYMSPEQVRGLPVDRRSDVFSCGIVLYELLTGERLFVGESDFSTLEKVRNVEILPPSTYNRKIQPELERIVLKALAKDVEDRYQNAIDLHDELQAFVYTAGEFYSRKDLASWMKQMWAQEIKEESAKIASYRDMSPPVQTSPPGMLGEPPRAATLSLNARKTNPPPIPGTRSPASRPPPIQQQAVGAGLEWDDDELETSIYDDEDPSASDQFPSPPTLPTPAAAPSAMAAAAAEPSPTLPSAPPLAGSALSGDTAVTPQDEPDLSSLVATSHGWDAPQAKPQGHTADSPSRVADGSNKTKAPLGPGPVGPVEANAQRPGEVSEVIRMANMATAQAPEGQPILVTDFAPSPQPPGRRSNLLYGLIAISILIAGGIIAVVLVGQSGKSDSAVAGKSGEGQAEGAAAKTVDKTAKSAATEARPALETSRSTGFDLIVDPPGVKVSLDGRPIGKAPLQIRSLRAGEHFIEIEAPPGFFSKHETVTVSQGVAERVEMRLDAMEIQASFVSEPSGATVLLVANGVTEEIGKTPLHTFKLDPRKQYEVVFKKDGHATLTKPVEITGSPDVKVSGRMARERSSSRSRDARDEPAVATLDRARDDEPKVVAEREESRPAESAKPVERAKPSKAVARGATGTLLLSAKPPCKIFIDGRDTGKVTPQRDISLSPGQHRITLLNNEYGIKESFSVNIKASEATRAIKNFTDQIK